MAAYLSTELGGSANQTSAPVGYKPRATAYGARLRRIRGTFTYASQVFGTDTLVVGNLPAGATFAFGTITTSVTTGTATIAVGIAGSTSKYAAAAAYTTANAPTLFGTAATVGAADPALTAEEQVFCTIGTANLPASGTLVVDLYYSMP